MEFDIHVNGHISITKSIIQPDYSASSYSTLFHSQLLSEVQGALQVPDVPVYGS